MKFIMFTQLRAILSDPEHSAHRSELYGALCNLLIMVLGSIAIPLAIYFIQMSAEDAKFRHQLAADKARFNQQLQQDQLREKTLIMQSFATNIPNAVETVWAYKQAKANWMLKDLPPENKTYYAKRHEKYYEMYLGLPQSYEAICALAAVTFGGAFASDVSEFKRQLEALISMDIFLTEHDKVIINPEAEIQREKLFAIYNDLIEKMADNIKSSR